MTDAPNQTAVDAVSVWRLTYVRPDPPLERYGSMHTFAIVDVRRGAYLALEITHFPRVPRLFPRVRTARPPRILPRCSGGDEWHGLNVCEGGRSSEPPAGGPGEGPLPPPVRALWMVSLRDPARSPVAMVVEDGPLDLAHGPADRRERWQVSGRAVPDGIQVEFDFDHEFVSRAEKLIIRGFARAASAMARVDPRSTNEVPADTGQRGGSRGVQAPTAAPRATG